MKLFEQIVVDLYKLYPLKQVNMQQNNIGRGVIITLTAGGSVVDPSDEDVKLWAQRPDGAVSYLPCTVQPDGTIRAPFSSQMLSVPGRIIVSLELINGEDDITTPIFYVENDKNIANHDAAESQNEFTALQQTLAQVNESLREVEILKTEGLKGDPGKAATIRIGSVSASAAGSTPEITNSGTENAAVLNFVLPRGEQGPPGEQGLPGESVEVIDPMLATAAGVAADALKTKEQFDELNKNMQNNTSGSIIGFYITKTFSGIELSNAVKGTIKFTNRNGIFCLIVQNLECTPNKPILPLYGYVGNNAYFYDNDCTGLYIDNSYLYSTKSIINYCIFTFFN